ncbi:hypothetical protein [Streptomyces sp. G-5]|nr:hypothetical protein [Streptomyces sp. G-5]MCU4750290.1 hypothetical protein [Streptomyces sp. G-5]
MSQQQNTSQNNSGNNATLIQRVREANTRTKTNERLRNALR